MNELSKYQTQQQEVTNILQYLKDESALVRAQAIRATADFNIKNIENFISPLLYDSIRLVRNTAAQILNKSTPEYLQQLEANSDFAAGQHQLGIFHERQNNINLAINAYKKAITIDNHFNASRINLALLYYQTGQINKAEKLYIKVQEQEPDFDQSFYMLGLLYNEQNKKDNAIVQLEKAYYLNPYNVNAVYNMILILDSQGFKHRANEKLTASLKKFPFNEKLLSILLNNQINNEDYSNAILTCNKLIQINPNKLQYQQLKAQLQVTQ